ncbi:MAG: type 1 glutamine amidotransferase, partial [Paraglaciecola sp.]
MTNKRINAYLICGGDFHDMDFARLELLKVMAENPNIRVKVGSDYSDIKAILDADFLVTYTCNVIPDAAQSQAIKVWLSSGKKWYALHGTNSICQFLSFDPVCVSTPRDAPELMDMLGSQFLAHPPTCDYRVHVTDPNHELVIGIEDFDTYDELYLSEFYGNHHCLLHTHFNGVVADFEEGQQWSDDNIRPVMYLNPYG